MAEDTGMPPGGTPPGDLPPEMDAMADAAGDAAAEAYNAVIADGGTIAQAGAAGMEAAGTVMSDMGAPPEMVDAMVTAATEGINNAVEAVACIARFRT